MTFERGWRPPDFRVNDAVGVLARSARVKRTGDAQRTILEIHPHDEVQAEQAVRQVASLLGQWGHPVTVHDSLRGTTQVWAGNSVIDAKPQGDDEKPRNAAPRFRMILQGVPDVFARMIEELFPRG